MSSISVAKHNAKRTPIGVLFALAGALVASLLALRAKRRRIRFAFEPKAVGELAHQRLGEESSLLRSKNEYPGAKAKPQRN